MLELSVQPGGSRWAELHAYSNPAHIRAWLEAFCKNDAGTSAYHAIWYGATLGIWIVQQGKVVNFIDLYPHISARVGDSQAVPIEDDAGCRALVRGARKPVERNEDDEEDDDDEFDHEDEDLDTYDAMRLELDWAAIEGQLPPLMEPLLLPGQRTRIRLGTALPEVASYLEGGSIEFGSYDHEAGVHLDPPFSLPSSESEDDDDDEDDEDD